MYNQGAEVAATPPEFAPSPPRTHHSTVRWIWVIAVILLLVFMISVGLAFANGMDPMVLLEYGYPGISLIMFFSSATVLLPAPGFAAVLGAGTVINPWLVGPFAGLGSAFGEMTGYMVGLGSREAIEARRGKWWSRAESWMKKNGFLTVLVFASFPNPFFDAIGVLAGSMGLPIKRVFIACLIGNTIKYTSLALLGSSALGLLKFFD
ncbi:MAG TPA: VTT domain-containing protein [Chloroflexota bacterium]|nr:VTT domain-containing protein [Chloroflexota bacterium]